VEPTGAQGALPPAPLYSIDMKTVIVLRNIMAKGNGGENQQDNEAKMKSLAS
jgi:hypothetical protein